MIGSACFGPVRGRTSCHRGRLARWNDTVDRVVDTTRPEIAGTVREQPLRPEPWRTNVRRRVGAGPATSRSRSREPSIILARPRPTSASVSPSSQGAWSRRGSERHIAGPSPAVRPVRSGGPCALRERRDRNWGRSNLDQESLEAAHGSSRQQFASAYVTKGGANVDEGWGRPSRRTVGDEGGGKHGGAGLRFVGRRVGNDDRFDTDVHNYEERMRVGLCEAPDAAVGVQEPSRGVPDVVLAPDRIALRPVEGAIPIASSSPW